MKLKFDKKLLVTSLIILLPVLAGLLLWNKLPESMATHWNFEGIPDGYSSRHFAVFGIPGFLFAIHIICIIITKADPKAMNHSKKIMSLIYWICPTVSIFCMTAVFIYALGYPVSMKLLGPLFCGVLFMIIGNYLPKCKPNYTIGIKVPWTLNSTENWTKTHRFAGPLWFFSGILIIVFSLFSLDMLSFIALLITVFIPILYSYLYFRKYECRK